MHISIQPVLHLNQEFLKILMIPGYIVHWVLHMQAWD